MKKINLCLFAFVLILVSSCQSRKPLSAIARSEYEADWPIESPDSQLYHKILSYQRAEMFGKGEVSEEKLKEALRLKPKSPYLRTRLAYINLRENKIEDAKNNLNIAIKEDPKYVPALRLLARVEALTGNIDNAESIYQKIVKLDPDNAEQDILFLVSLYLDMNKPDQAFSLLDKQIQKEPRNFLYHFYMGRVLTQKNELDLAVEEYQTVIRLKPDFIPAYKSKALVLEYQDKPALAEQTFLDGIKRDPANKDLRIRLAQLYLNQKKYRAANEQYLKILEYDPNNYEALIKLALLDFQEEKYLDSEKKFQQLLKQNPDDDLIPYYLALVQEKQEKYDQAIVNLKKVPLDNKFGVDAVLVQSRILVKKNDYSKAESLLEKLIQSENEENRVYITLSKIYLDQKKDKQAISLLKKRLKGNPKDQEVLFALGELYEKLDQFSDFESTMDQLIDINPNHVSALNYLGYAYVDRNMTNKLEKAVKLIQRALSFEPNDGYITDSLGWAQYRQGKYKEARKTLERANQLAPKETVILEHLGDTLMKLGLKKKALKKYEESLKYVKKDSDRKRLQQKIGQ